MAKTKNYGHFCVIARSLEVIGEKWTLLVVRDLLRGPQRFSDLIVYMGGITPKWLTARLRELEAAGIIERDSAPGRREVWYRLTQKGRDLAPVLEALTVWGIEHASRPPLPGEPVFPEMVLQASAAYLTRRGIQLPGPATWRFRAGPRMPVVLRYDGARWSSNSGDVDADVTITTTPEDLTAFLSARRRDRGSLVERLQIDGTPEGIDVFRSTMLGVPRAAAASA